MELVEAIALTYKKGPQVWVPPALVLHGENGEKWLKLRASSFAISKLLLGHLETFKNIKNPSLSASPQIKAIQEKIKAAVVEHKHGGQEEGDLFGSEGDGDAGPQSKDRMRQFLQDAPPTVAIQLGEHTVHLKTPKSWKESDILVPMDPTSLTIVADYILQDAHGWLDKDTKKRPYVRTGNFSKKAKLTEKED